MDRDVEIRSLHEQLERQGQALVELQEKTEGIDLNRRLSMLILTCDDFISKTTDEDVEEKVVQVLNRRFSWLNMTSADIQAAHRLQANNKVVVRFVKRRVRDAVYDGRFELFGKTRNGARAGSDLYITESLTPRNREIYSRLLEARKPANGGKVASVFSRRGMVYCRLERGGPNVRVPDLQQLQRILGGDRGGRGSRGSRPDSARSPPSGGARRDAPAPGLDPARLAVDPGPGDPGRRDPPAPHSSASGPVLREPERVHGPSGAAPIAGAEPEAGPGPGTGAGAGAGAEVGSGAEAGTDARQVPSLLDRTAVRTAE